MRIIWKDSSSNKQAKVYRGYDVYGTTGGWRTSLVDDDNIYLTYIDAFNAVDKKLGGYGKFGSSVRSTKPIIVVNVKNAI